MAFNFKHLICVFIGVLATTCSTAPIKKHPEYKGIDPRFESLVKEYKEIAKIQKITFKNEVTIGFKKINEDDIVGLCNYGEDWREIDIDLLYWENTTNTTHLALLFHELTHCYCDRGHDYGKKKEYPTPKEIRENEREQIRNLPGYYEDGCPLSLMHPIVVEDECVTRHYDDYIHEMFDRCEVW